MLCTNSVKGEGEGYGLCRLVIYTYHHAPRTNPLLINCYHNIICTYRVGRLEPFCLNETGYCLKKNSQVFMKRVFTGYSTVIFTYKVRQSEANFFYETGVNF